MRCISITCSATPTSTMLRAPSCTLRILACLKLKFYKSCINAGIFEQLWLDWMWTSPHWAWEDHLHRPASSTDQDSSNSSDLENWLHIRRPCRVLELIRRCSAQGSQWLWLSCWSSTSHWWMWPNPWVARHGPPPRSCWWLLRWSWQTSKTSTCGGRRSWWCLGVCCTWRTLWSPWVGCLGLECSPCTVRIRWQLLPWCRLDRISADVAEKEALLGGAWRLATNVTFWLSRTSVRSRHTTKLRKCTSQASNMQSATPKHHARQWRPETWQCMGKVLRQLLNKVAGPCSVCLSSDALPLLMVWVGGYIYYISLPLNGGAQSEKTPFFGEKENHQDRPRSLEPHDIFHLHDHQHLSLCINTFPRKNRRTTTTFVRFLVFLACFGGKHGIQGGPTADPAMAGYCFINFRTSQARRSGIGKSRPRKLRLRQQRWDHWHRQPTK